MALSKLIETKQNISLENAYIKIIEQSGNKENINIRVAIYKDKESCDNRMESLEQIIYSFTPTLEDNFIKQGYEYLKILEIYEDSVDC